MSFHEIEGLDRGLATTDLEVQSIPKEALFLAGKTHLAYRKRKGTKRSPYLTSLLTLRTKGESS